VNARNVIVLFGINAAGKTSVGTELARILENAPLVQSSKLLMEKFGCDRHALERLNAAQKEIALREAVLGEFVSHAAKPHVIADMHLLVTIRRDGATRREHLWSDDYAPFIRAAFFLDVPPEEILRRRMNDEKRTGRVRDTNLDNIRHDRTDSLDDFRTKPARAVPLAKIIECDIAANDLAKKIAQLLAAESAA
jgi:thymidylate kinase